MLRTKVWCEGRKICAKDGSFGFKNESFVLKTKVLGYGRKFCAKDESFVLRTKVKEFQGTLRNLQEF